jgi:2-keto-4-pentenoate hydratase/2-oxohepta-3-ene-1,7-dioic acid hydratase in catechol pathway
VTRDEIEDIEDLHLETRLNGEVMQSASTGDLIFSVPGLIEYCSTFTRLEPGDIIATGTPGGVGAARTPPVWMKPGDTIEISIAGIGVLRNTIVDE